MIRIRRIESLLILCLISITTSKQTIESILQEIKNDFMPLRQMRSNEVAQQYLEFWQNLNQNNISVSDYVKQSKFGYSGNPQHSIYFISNITYQSQTFSNYILSDTPNIYEWFPLTLDQSSRVSGLSEQNPFLLLTVNTFPYDFQEDIEHWLVWSNRDVQIEVVQEFIHQFKSASYELVIYINSQNKKSIPEVFHVHVIVYKPKSHEL